MTESILNLSDINDFLLLKNIKSKLILVVHGAKNYDQEYPQWLNDYADNMVLIYFQKKNPIILTNSDFQWEKLSDHEYYSLKYGTYLFYYSVIFPENISLSENYYDIYHDNSNNNLFYGKIIHSLQKFFQTSIENSSSIILLDYVDRINSSFFPGMNPIRFIRNPEIFEEFLLGQKMELLFI